MNWSFTDYLWSPFAYAYAIEHRHVLTRSMIEAAWRFAKNRAKKNRAGLQIWAADIMRAEFDAQSRKKTGGVQ